MEVAPAALTRAHIQPSVDGKVFAGRSVIAGIASVESGFMRVYSPGLTEYDAAEEAALRVVCNYLSTMEVRRAWTRAPG